MSMILVAARLLLALVFAVAGLAKLADRRGTREAVAAFGSPAEIAGGLAIALPVAELAVAALLLPARTALYGAIGAVALLVLFTAALATALARGESPDCHCFGQLHSTPASRRTLARNGALLAVALVVLGASAADPPPSAFAWVGDLEGAELLALVVAIAACVVLGVVAAAFVSLMRSYGQVLTRLERVEGALARVGLSLAGETEMPHVGLPPGSPVPSFTARMASDEVVGATLFAGTLPTLLLFTSPGCGQCTVLMPRVARWQRDHAERLSIVVASAGALEDIRAEAEELGLENVLHDEASRLSELFGAAGTPSAVLVTPEATIASWVASGQEWIEHLVEQTGEPAGGEGLPLGAEAPGLELPSLTGELVPLASLRGRDALLVFWNPGCGYCRELHPELLAREAGANGEGPRLVVVSSGDEESTRAEGFSSLVLLDRDYRAGAAFGAHGTPMAVLLDAEGKVASHVVAGGDAVLELADGRGST